MGCCPSTSRKPDPAPIPTRSTSSRRRTTAAPPPPEEEEETVVKEVLSETPKPPLQNPTRFPLKPVSKPPETADVSESSEISVSTVPPEEEYSGEVRRPAVRSPAKTRTTRRYSGELRNNPGPSPGRVGMRGGRERSTGAVAASRRRENGGETSGRRDSSPAAAAARSGLGRNLSGKKTGRVGSEIVDRRIEEEKRVAPTVGDESLENPLVSLECFIFL